MNTNNIMAMSAQPTNAKVATSTKSANAKGSSKTGAKASGGMFDDVLDKASTDLKGTTKEAVYQADSKQADDMDLDNGQSDSQSASSDILAMCLASSATANEAASEVTPVVEVETTTSAVAMELSTEAQADMVEVPTENMTDVKNAPVANNLQSVLPQDSQVLQQNNNFLAMLSGQQLKAVSTKETVQSPVVTNNVVTSAVPENQPMTDILSAQLANSANKANSVMAAVNNAASAAAEPANVANIATVNFASDDKASATTNEQLSVVSNNAANMTLAADLAALNANSKLNATINLTTPMATVNQPTETTVNDTSLSELIDSSKLTIVEENVVQTAVPTTATIVSEQTPVVTKSNDQVTSNNQLAVNNNNGQVMVTPNTVVQSQAAMNDDSAMDWQQQQQQPQSSTTNASEAVLANLGDDVEAMTELPEEAVGDRVMIKNTTTTETTNNTNTANSAPVSVFQQDLQDSLTGATKTDSATTNQPTTDYDIPKQIIDQARLIRRAENTEMVIKLNPEHLGELTLKVSVTSNGSVNASFHSDNAQVRTIIENSLVNLRQELNNQGLKVDNVDVYAGLADGQLPQGEGQQAWQQQQSQQGKATTVSVNMTAEDYLEEVAEVAAVPTTTTSGNDGVDYRV